jgi:hypothetical protein
LTASVDGVPAERGVAGAGVVKIAAGRAHRAGAAAAIEVVARSAVKIKSARISVSFAETDPPT